MYKIAAEKAKNNVFLQILAKKAKIAKLTD